MYGLLNTRLLETLYFLNRVVHMGIDFVNTVDGYFKWLVEYLFFWDCDLHNQCRMFSGVHCVTSITIIAYLVWVHCVINKFSVVLTVLLP